MQLLRRHPGTSQDCKERTLIVHSRWHTCRCVPAQWGGRGGAMCRVSIAQGQPLRDVHSATATMREAAHDLTVAAALSKLARPRCSEPPSWCPLLPVQWGGHGGSMCRVSIAQGQPLHEWMALQDGGSLKQDVDQAPSSLQAGTAVGTGERGLCSWSMAMPERSPASTHGTCKHRCATTQGCLSLTHDLSNGQRHRLPWKKCTAVGLL